MTRRACTACGKASPAATVAACRVRCSWPGMPTAALPVADRDLLPGQVPKLGIQAGLVLLHHQDVMRVLLADEELGVLALGIHVR